MLLNEDDPTCVCVSNEHVCVHRQSTAAKKFSIVSTLTEVRNCIDSHMHITYILSRKILRTTDANKICYYRMNCESKGFNPLRDKPGTGKEKET